MTDGTPATRHEFDSLSRRVEQLDEHGTRGIGPLAVQLTEVIKDLTDLRTAVDTRFAAHEKQHEREEARRVSARRWVVATVIAAVAAVDGPLATLLLARR